MQTTSHLLILLQILKLYMQKTTYHSLTQNCLYTEVIDKFEINYKVLSLKSGQHKQNVPMVPKLLISSYCSIKANIE